MHLPANAERLAIARSHAYLKRWILIPVCLMICFAGYSQNISLSVNNASLKEVFRAIERKTDYYFQFTDDQLEGSANVNLEMEDQPLKLVLDEIFQSRPITWSMKGKYIVIRERGDASEAVKTITVTGAVLDDSSRSPLAGATIRSRITGSAAQSDGKGRFRIETADNDVLTVSFLGYENAEWKVNNQSNVTIRLKKSAQSIREVVVTTAYGVERKAKELGYAVSTVSGEELNRTNPSSVLTGLAGRVSGLSVATQSADLNPQMRVLLRGIRSISSGASNQPLFVLNGSPLSFGTGQAAATLALDFINNINPNDIQDVTILKGANGTALYGPEGVNGVIIITTKKGNRGGKPAVNFITSRSFQRADFRNQQFQQEFGPGSVVDANGKGVYDPVAEGGWGAPFDGRMVQIGRPDINGDVQMVPYEYTNNRRKFYQTAQTSQYNLSILHSDARSDFYLGLRHMDMTGLLPGDFGKRSNMMLNTGRYIGKFGVRLNMLAGHSKLDQGPKGMVKTINAIPGHIPLSRYKDWQHDKWASHDNYWSDYSRNPYFLLENSRTKTIDNGLLTSLEFKLSPFRWLSIIDRLGTYYHDVDGRSTNGQIVISDFAVGKGPIRARKVTPASMAEDLQKTFIINNDLLVQTNHQIRDFSIKTNLGYTVRESSRKSFKGTANQLIIPVFNFDFNSVPSVVEERAELSRFLSALGNAVVGYQDKVFLEFAGRNDWDSKMAVAARNKNFYYGTNLSVLLPEIIPGLKNYTWLSDVRLRASFVKAANMNIDPYKSENRLQLSPGFPYQSLLGYSLGGGIPNPDLVPEKVLSREFGGSFQFLDKRVSLDVTHYYQRNNGMLLDAFNSAYSAYPTTVNAGRFDNWGWEFDLKLDPLLKLDNGLSVTAGARLSINDNRVVKLMENYNGVIYAKQSGGTDFGGVPPSPVAILAMEGGHAYTFKLYDWMRDPDGRVIVNRMSGMPSVDFANPIYRGRSLPKYIGGADINISWRKFNLYALGEYYGGVDHFFGGAAGLMMRGMSPLSTLNGRERFVMPNSVYHDGSKYVENNDIQVRSAHRDFYFLMNSASNQFLSSGGFFKIREMSVSYAVDLKNKMMKNLNVALYSRDLFSFYPRSNILGDPQLIKGPGYSRAVSADGKDGSRRTDHSTGSDSDEERLNGTFLIGIRVGAAF